MSGTTIDLVDAEKHKLIASIQARKTLPKSRHFTTFTVPANPAPRSRSRNLHSAAHGVHSGVNPNRDQRTPPSPQENQTCLTRPTTSCSGTLPN